MIFCNFHIYKRYARDERVKKYMNLILYMMQKKFIHFKNLYSLFFSKQFVEYLCKLPGCFFVCDATVYRRHVVSVCKSGSGPSYLRLMVIMTSTGEIRGRRAHLCLVPGRCLF